MLKVPHCCCLCDAPALTGLKLLALQTKLLYVPCIPVNFRPSLNMVCKTRSLWPQGLWKECVRSFFELLICDILLVRTLQCFAFGHGFTDWALTFYFAGSGLVLSCGSNSFGQLGVPKISGPCLIPQKIEVKI